MSAITQKIIKQIYKFFPDFSMSFNVSWPHLTTLGAGNGTVPLVIEPIDDLTLSQFLKFCYNEGIRVFPIGGGSNIVGTDKEFQGIVLKLRQNNFGRVKISNMHATVGAGLRLYDFILSCAHNNLGGIEQLVGIPGTLGGSLQTNAGRFGVTISDVIQEICGFDLQGSAWCANAKDIEWGYRYSSIPKDVIVTAVICKLKSVDSPAAVKSIQDYMLARKNIYPLRRNAGCVFRNPSSGHGAGKLIEFAGCKKYSIGGAKVSSKHANFILNNAHASEKDFLDLAIHVKKQVLDKTGIYLEPEVCFADNNSHNALTSNPKKLKVAVLKGGNSHERAVSLESAEGVFSALKEAGYDVRDVDLKEPVVTEEMKKADIVFPMLHGGFGENGQIQKELEKLHIPYVGCTSKASKLIMDKIKTKEFFDKHNILTPKYAVLKEGEATFPKNLSLPVVVKPPAEGSTFGVSIVKDMTDWIPALEKAAANNNENKLILVEDYIHGPEVTVGVLNGIPLPIVHICYPGEMYDYDAKYTHNTGETKYICPPDVAIVPPNLQNKLRKIAVKAYNLVKAKDMLRVDFILSKETKQPFCIEMNTIPGFTNSSNFPRAAAKADIPYIQLCGTLVQQVVARNK